MTTPTHRACHVCKVPLTTTDRKTGPFRIDKIDSCVNIYHPERGLSGEIVATVTVCDNACRKAYIRGESRDRCTRFRTTPVDTGVDTSPTPDDDRHRPQRY